MPSHHRIPLTCLAFFLFIPRPAGATTINNVPRPLPGGCSNNAAMACRQNGDCGAGNACNNPTPGAQGACDNDATKRCSKNADCNAPGECTNPPPTRPGGCNNDATRMCFEDDDCASPGLCRVPPPFMSGGCKAAPATPCFQDADCGAGDRCLNPRPRPFSFRQAPGLGPTLNTTFMYDSVGHVGMIDMEFQQLLANWSGARKNAPVDILIESCFGGGFANKAARVPKSTFASAAAWYESAVITRYNEAGGCAADATRKCIDNSDCAAGDTCTNPAFEPSPDEGGCSNDTNRICIRDADCVGKCGNFAPPKVYACAEDSDCSVCSNDAGRLCLSDLGCRKPGTCVAPAAGTCARTATCNNPLPGGGHCSTQLDQKRPCLQNADCLGRCSDNLLPCSGNGDCKAPATCSRPAAGTCLDSGAGGCSNNAAIPCLDNTPCAAGGGTCTSPPPRPLVRGVDGFPRAWRQSANDPNRLGLGMLDHFSAAITGVAGKVAPDPYSRTDLPLTPEHPQYRSPDAANNGPNNTRTLRSPDPGDNSNLYAILVVWGAAEPLMEVDVARVYNTLVAQYNIPASNIALLYGNLPGGSRIGNYPARADGKPAILGGLHADAGSEASLVNPNNALGFFVDGPASKRNLIRALKGEMFTGAAPKENDRLLLWVDGHGSQAQGRQAIAARVLNIAGRPKAEFAIDIGTGLSLGPGQAEVTNTHNIDGTVLLELATRSPFDLTAYPEMGLKMVNQAGQETDLGRFADHPEWLAAASSPSFEIPDLPAGDDDTYYQISVPESALRDPSTRTDAVTVALDGFDDSFLASYPLMGLYLAAGDQGYWTSLSPGLPDISFANASLIGWSAGEDEVGYDIAVARTSGPLGGDFRQFQAYVCDASLPSINVSARGNPPLGGLDLWLVRSRSTPALTRGTWDEGSGQFETRDRGPLAVPPVCP